MLIEARATQGINTAISSKSEEIIDGRRRELRARAGAGPCRRARTPDGRAGPDRALRREDSMTPRNFPLFGSEDSATGDSSQSRGGGGSIDWRP